MDNFFNDSICSRCGKSAPFTMSLFNLDKICVECQDKEKQHPDYPKAVTAELAELKKGNRNFKGIGKPKDL